MTPTITRKISIVKILLIHYTRSALVENDLADTYVNQHVAIVRLSDKEHSKFVFLTIISPRHGRAQLQDAAYGAGKPGLNLDNIRDVIIYLPPLEEQKEIVRRVEDLFKFAGQIEERYKKARSYTDKLTQSILAKAFRGELVPQDPDDEPASKLLERIKVLNKRT